MNTRFAQYSTAAVIGALGGLFLIGFEWLVHQMEHLWWHHIPELIAVDATSTMWLFAVLGVGGVVVGMIVRYFPGGAGHDPATEGLFGEPMPITAVLGLVAAALISLSIGASLGPEAPLLGATSAILAWAAHRRNLPQEGLVSLGIAGLLGAMFGAPVGAAFAFIELMPLTGKALYERMVPLFIASTAGALTITSLVGRPRFLAPFPVSRDFLPIDIVTAAAIGVMGAVAGLLVGVALRRLHPVAVRIPVVARMGFGGVMLAGAAFVAGDIILFSGQREIETLVEGFGSYSGVELVLIAGFKLLSLIVAVAFGFRGGRIFPAVFVGVAIGAVIHYFVADIPFALAAGAATVGIVLALIRVWLLTLMLVAMIVGIEWLPVLGVALIAAHLVVQDRKPVQVAHH
jgi:H+/Cl- antiporter ClcA